MNESQRASAANECYLTIDPNAPKFYNSAMDVCEQIIRASIRAKKYEVSLLEKVLKGEKV